MVAELSLRTERVDDIVLLLHVMLQMELEKILNEHLPRHWKQKGLDWSWLIVVWLAYILSEGDHRKVMVRDWVKQRQQMLEQVCGIEIGETDFSDDRLGIVLKHLSEESTWQGIEKQLNRQSVRVYQLPSKTVRLDATTVSGNHVVSEEGIFQFGHSKDDPSLAQVKVMMGVLDPLGMPLCTQVVSGEQADDGLYLPAFEQARESLDCEDLLWVGDCKMGALATRSHLHHQHHYYLTPLARVGQVPELTRQWLEQQEAGGKERERVRILKADGSLAQELTGYAMERSVEGKTSHGHGVCWKEQVFLAHSPSHHQKQQRGLEKRLENATAKLLALTPKVGRGRKQIRSPQELHKRAGAILKAHHVEPFLGYHFIVEEPTKTRKVRCQITEVCTNGAALKQYQQGLGWRVYVSNVPLKQLSFSQAVLSYRNEWIVERGFHRLKGKSLGAHPLFVRRDDQVQGLLNLLSLGLRLLSIIEFVVHRQLQRSQDSLSGLFPENPQKSTNKPSAERILKAFDNITLSYLEVDGQSHRHLPTLTPLQQKLIQLLGFSSNIYNDLLQPLPPNSS